MLDAIWFGLGGGQALPEEPIRKGAAKGEIRLGLGEMLVPRTFTHKGSYLKVMNKEGLRWKSPQKVLNQLLGKLSFDPLAFACLDEGKQRELLLSLVTIPLSYEHLQRLSGVAVQENGDPIGVMNALYKTVYDQRADHHRNVKRLDDALFVLLLSLAVELKRGEGGWVDKITLWEKGVVSSPISYQAYSNLRNTLLRALC